MLTLSLGQALLFDRPSPWSWPKDPRLDKPNTGNARGPAPGPHPNGPRRRPSSLFERVPWKRRDEVVVTRGSSSALEAFAQRAARPRAAVEERNDMLVLSLDAPGARAKNTEVIWDEAARRLVVGVWLGSRPGRRRGVAPPELAWYRSHWLPRAAGDAARVTVKNGTIEIRVPWRATGTSRS